MNEVNCRVVTSEIPKEEDVDDSIMDSELGRFLLLFLT